MNNRARLRLPDVLTHYAQAFQTNIFHRGLNVPRCLDVRSKIKYMSYLRLRQDDSDHLYYLYRY